MLRPQGTRIAGSHKSKGYPPDQAAVLLASECCLFTYVCSSNVDLAPHYASSGSSPTSRYLSNFRSKLGAVWFDPLAIDLVLSGEKLVSVLSYKTSSAQCLSNAMPDR